MELIMRKMVPFIAAILLTSAAVACKNPTKNVEPAVVADAVEVAPVEQAEAPVATQTIALNSENTKVTWIGSKVTGAHDGGFNTVSGEMTVAGTVDSIRGHIDIDVTSIYSDEDKLTEHLRSGDFFSVEQYPSAKFVVTNIGEEGDEGKRVVTGNLTLRGVEKSITFPAAIAVTDTNVTFEALFKINRKDFGIVYDGQADDLIRDDVAIEFKVDAARPQ